MALFVLLSGAGVAQADRSCLPAEYGNWINADQSGRTQIKRVALFSAGDIVLKRPCASPTPRFWARVYASTDASDSWQCYPDLCDWGWVPVEKVADPWGIEGDWYTTEHDFGSGWTFVWMRAYPWSPGWLRVISVTIHRDGRRNSSDGWFLRQGN